MSVIPFSLDVSVALPQGKPVERKEGGSEHLNLHLLAPGRGGEEERKTEERQQEEVTKPALNVLESSLEFSQDQETGLTIVKMYDRENGNVILQLPPEETLAFLRRVAEDKKGVLVSKKL